jgi:hypothetical protein
MRRTRHPLTEIGELGELGRLGGAERRFGRGCYWWKRCIGCRGLLPSLNGGLHGTAAFFN